MAAAALLLGAVAVVPALAQEPDQEVPETHIESHAVATPNKAGTPKDPQGMRVKASARLIVEPGFDPPIVTALDILIGKGLHWERAKYAKCSKATLDRKGPRACPPESIMGSALATGMADTVAAHLKVTFVNGGTKQAYAYATLDNPARVQTTLVVKSTPLGGQWDHRESVKIPESLQIVAGVPVRLTDVKMDIGGKPYAPDFVNSTSCPDGGWKYQVTAHYLYDLLNVTAQDVHTGSVPCRK